MGRAAAFDVFILSDTRDERDGAAEEAAYRALRAPPAGRHPRLLPPPPREPRPQVRQHQGLGAPLRRRLRALRHSRRRQRHVGHDARAPGARHAARREGRSHPDGAAPHRRDDAAAVPAAVRLQRLRAARSPPASPSGIATRATTGATTPSSAPRRSPSAAGLPTLPGRAPFGGDIQSHDFVEAVLLQRADWGVHIVPTVEGSYEGQPPTLPDVIARDRRWAQGNLQHLSHRARLAASPPWAACIC